MPTMPFDYRYKHPQKNTANQIQQHIQQVIPYDQAAFIPGIQVGSTYRNQYHINRIKDKNYLIILIDAGKLFDKMQYSSLVAQMVKSLPKMRETCVQFLGWEETLEKEMSTYSSTPAWKIPWMEEPGRL